MTWPRRLLGWFGALLGVVGVVACLAGLIGVWILHARIQGPVTEITAILEDLGVTVETHARDLAAGIQGARDRVSNLDQRVTARTQDVLHLTEEDLDQIGALQVQVRGLVQRMRDWAEFARASTDLVDQFVGMVGSSVGFLQADPEARETIRVALANGREEVETAAALLNEVADQLIALRAGADPVVEGKIIASLTERIDATLGAMQRQVQAFSAGVGELTDGVVALRDRIRRTLRTLAVVFSLLLLWQGAAQSSLAWVGWGFARSAAPPVRGAESDAVTR